MQKSSYSANTKYNWDKLSAAAQQAQAMIPSLNIFGLRSVGRQDPAAAVQPNMDRLERLTLELSQIMEQLGDVSAIQMANLTDAQARVFRQAQPKIIEIGNVLDELDAPDAPVSAGHKRRLKYAMRICKWSNGTVGSVVKGLKLDSHESVQEYTSHANIGGVTAAGVPIIAAGTALVQLVVSLVDLGQSWHQASGGEITEKIFGAAGTLIGAGKNTYAGAMAIGKMAGKGFAEAAKNINGLAIVGMVVGGVQMGTGITKALKAGGRYNNSDQILDFTEDPHEVPDPAKTPERLKKFQMVRNVAVANRRKQEREITSGVFQFFEGGLNALAGFCSLTAVATFGAGMIAGAVFSGLSVLTSLTQALVEHGMKKAERTSAIDNYLGIIDYCNDLRQNDPNALAMSESRLRDLIRTEAAGKLGFPDADSFYAHIMWLYAVSLYEAAYLDENGQVLPLPDKDDLRELPPNELRQRILASGRNVLDEDEDEEEEDEEEEEEEAGSSMRDRAQNQRDQEFAQSEHERKIFLLMICYLGFDYLYEKNGTPATTPEMIFAKLTS